MQNKEPPVGLKLPGRMSHKKIAQAMTSRGFPMSHGTVFNLERSALQKLREAIAQDCPELLPEEIQ